MRAVPAALCAYFASAAHSRLSEAYLKQLCREQKQYTTANLNDQLYLNFKGIAKIEALEEYTG